MDKQKIGKKLRELRGDITVLELSKALGVSTSAISMYEIGERVPRDEVKLKYAKHFGKSVEEIFFADKVHD